MKDININRHDFNNAIERLSSFISKCKGEITLNGVEELSFLWFEHSVTGKEFNDLVKELQNHFQKIYDNHENYVKELTAVYTALNALDKDYIDAILIEVALIKEVNEKVQKAQDDIKKTIATQNKIIEVLQKHKERLDKYEHLADIDKIYQDNQAQRNAIISLEKSVKEQAKSIDALNETKELLNTMEHLQDIDFIYDEVTKNNNQISDMTEIFEKSEKNLLNKIKTTRILAVGSIGLVIIEFILIILRLI